MFEPLPAGATDVTLHVLYEDNHCLAVSKPAGMLTAADATGDTSLLDLAKQYLCRKYHKPGEVFLGLVHRLDRPVSGVVLFARTSKAAGRLSRQFRDGTVEKVYHCLVDGSPRETQATLTDWLCKDAGRNVTSVVGEGTPGAKEAMLDYRVLRRTAHRTLLEVRPRTGRSHQIRVQLASRGWPILGDVRYGGPSGTRRGVLALHARSLTFQHPVRMEPIRLTVDPPSDWQRWFPGAPQGRLPDE